MRIDIPAFLASLRFLVEGWLGIFAVIALVLYFFFFRHF